MTSGVVVFTGASSVVVPSVLAVVLAGVVRWGPGRWVVPASVVTAVAMAAWLWPATGDLAVPERVGASLFWAGPALLAVVVGGYPRLVAVRRAEAVERARREQRLQLARDLHDFLAHDISGIVAQAQAARYVAGSRPDAAGPALERIEAGGLAALATMDRVVRMLHASDDPALRPVLAGPGGPALQPAPTLADLPVLIERFGGAGDVEVRLTLAPGVVGLSRLAAATAYRVVVEALTNVRRHAAGATRVDVSVAGDASGVEVRIRDNGAGPAPSPRRRSGGRGLRDLRTRVTESGGTLSAGPARGPVASKAPAVPAAGGDGREPVGHGWEVVAVIPGSGE